MINDLDDIRARGAAPVPLSSPGIADLAWLYLPGEYEAAVLDRLVAEGRAASRYVEFAENYRRPVKHLDLRLAAGTTGHLLTAHHLQATNAHTEVTRLEGHWWQVRSTREGCAAEVQVAADGVPGVAACAAAAQEWQVSRDALRWQAASLRPGGETPAHLAGEPTHEVAATPLRDGVWELPRQVLGRVLITADTVPSVVTGESLPELRTSMPELRFDLEPLPDGRWASKFELCGRYLLVEGAVTAVVVESRSRPHTRVGAFACSDERLTDIWRASALTLHLCMQSLVVDGLKRDRMPWAGDQALNTVSNAFAYGDGAIVRDGLVALGHPTHGYINGISDYSLWWVVNAWQYVRYFDDTAFSIEYAGHLDRFLEDLARDADADGVLRPSERPDGFVGASAGSVFIDWGYTLPPDGPSGALQVLWYWALAAGASLLTGARHPSAARWQSLADTVAGTLRARAWDVDAGRWRTALDVVDTSPGAHPNLFAVLSGLDPAPGDAVLDAIRDGSTGTPFMRGFALSALARGGRGAEAVAEIRERWGEMLDVGPGTMWEEFVGEEPYAMYGRPFAKSLCHAWASGPAALLPEILLGIRPNDAGWRTVRAEPSLGDLGWAAAVVPTPFGDLGVHAERERTRLWIPEGVSVELDGVLIRTAGCHDVPRSPREHLSLMRTDAMVARVTGREDAAPSSLK